MKIESLKHILFFILLFLLILTGCNEKNIVFMLEENDIELNVGDTYVPVILIENIEDYELVYSYDTDGIKEENNILYCLSSGFYQVRISIKDNTDVEPLMLNLYINEVIPTKISHEKEVKVYLDESYQLIPSIEPANAPKTFVYSSNDDNVAIVNEEGLVKGVSVGETYVIIKCKDYPNIKTRVLVKVEKAPVEKIESIESIKLDYNVTYQLSWNVLPVNSEQEVMFQSYDNTIASVDETGLITSFKFGTTKIKISSVKDSSKYCEVIVIVEGEKATDITVEEENIELQLGEEYKLNYSIIPSKAYQGLEFIIDDINGIEIDNNIIYSKKAGSYKITLKTIDGSNITKIINVNVVADEKPKFVTNSKFEKQSVLSWNEEFNPLDNIRAIDGKDGEITNQIVVTGEVDNRRYGEYTLEYYIEDSDGNSQTLVRTINVIWGYDVTVIGHAGSYYGVPNSEEAILYAAETLKYPAIEIDLKQTKDGIFVLSHDPKWGDAVLEQTNYEDLKDVEYTVTKTAGIVEGNLTEQQRTHTAKICTFERYLEICKQYNIIAVIELKTSPGISNWTEGNAPQTSKMYKIMELIEKHDMLDRVVFLSSQELCLNWVKTNGYDYIPCQYLTLSSCENEKTYDIVKKYKLDISFNVRDGIKISDEWLNKYRSLGCKLAVFTFEEWASYNDIQTWIDRGVDFVTTDWHTLDKLNLPKSEE